MSRLGRICNKSAEWHARRRNGIGSSDASTIMSGDETALIHLWQEKRGERQPDDLMDVIPVLVGTVTEPLNLALFERETGMAISRDGESVEHPDFPFMRSTLDGWAAFKNAVIECKHVGGFEPWETVVARYQPQIHHQCACTGASLAYLSVIVGTGKYQFQEIEPDPFYLAELIEREHAFWRCVDTGELPAALPAMAAPVPTEKMRVVDLTGSNAWANSAGIWLDTRDHAKRFAVAEKELKALIEPDVRRAFGNGIECIRDKRGYLKLGEMR